MKYCPQCKLEYQDDVAVCPIHGIPMQTAVTGPVPGAGPTKCLKCGAAVLGTDKYCPECGAHLISQGPLQPPQPEWTLVTFQMFTETLKCGANAFNPFGSDERLLMHSLNMMLLRQLRLIGIAKKPTPELIAAVIQAVDSHLTALQIDPSPNAQLFLPHATQAAALWLWTHLRLGPAEALGTDQVSMCPLPAKYKAILRIPQGLPCLTISFLIICSMFWSNESFFQVETVFGNNAGDFANVVCQSLRELFFLTYPTMVLKERFLAEENLKLNHGYYLQPVQHAVSDLLNTLTTACQKFKEDMAKIPGGQQNFLLVWISPISIPLMAAMVPCPCRTLTQSEQHAFDIFQNYGLDIILAPSYGAELLSFLQSMRNEQEANASNISVQNPLYPEFEMAHYFLTRYCNVLGPRVLSNQYKELPHKALKIPGMTIQALIQAGFQSQPEMASALIPQCKSIEMIVAELTAPSVASSAA